VGGAGTAPAESFHLKSIDAIGQLNKASRPREELGAEIRKNSEGVDIDAKAIDNLGQTIDLIWLVELGLITNDVIDAITHRKVLYNKFMDIKFWLNFDGIRLKT
jgi:hypothetical protein